MLSLTRKGSPLPAFFEPLFAAPVDDGEVVLRLRKPGLFKGVVRDGKGTPIAGAVAHLRYAEYLDPDGKQVGFNVIEHIVLGTELELYLSRTTDKQGVFVFCNSARCAQASLVVKAAGMGEYNTMNRPGPKGGSTISGSGRIRPPRWCWRRSASGRPCCNAVSQC